MLLGITPYYLVLMLTGLSILYKYMLNYLPYSNWNDTATTTKAGTIYTVMSDLHEYCLEASICLLLHARLFASGIHSHFAENIPLYSKDCNSLPV